MADREEYADILKQATTHAECYKAGLDAGDATGRNAAKLRWLLNRLDHVVAMWDADDPMGAYQVLVQSIRDARE